MRLFISICGLILAPISASGQIMIDTFAGGYIPSGVPAQNVAFGIIAGITRDSNGNLVFCDSTANVIRRINADGTIQTLGGVGIPGYNGDGGPAAGALLNAPAFPTYDAEGNLYFADTVNFRIRRIDFSGNIATVAGTGIQGTLGADGPATQAQISYVVGLAIDQSHNVYFAEPDYAVNGQGNPWEVRRITPSGQIEMYAGCAACPEEVDDVPATQSRFSLVSALASDQAGNLYISDGPHLLRVSSDGIIHHFAGFGAPSTTGTGNGGPALNAPPSDFIGLAADSEGDVYTEEVSTVMGGNGGFVIRRIGTDGNINVVAGTFTGTSQGDGPALQTELFPNYGSGLTADANGTVTFAEAYNLRQLTTQAKIQTVAGGQPLPAPDGTAALDTWFTEPNSLAFDRAGELYVGQTCIIQKIDSAGLLSTVAGTGQCSSTPPSGPALTTELTEVNSIAVDSKGQVYFADASGSVYVVSTEAVISKVADLNSGQQGIFPKLAIDSQDRVYFASFFGRFDRIAPGSPPQDFSNTFGPGDGQGIAVDAADNIYICCRNGAGAIERYTPDLNFTLLNISSFIDTSFPPAYGLAIDASSNVWQGNKSGPHPGLFKENLAFGGGCCSYGDGGAAESAYISPSALAFAPNGDLYFLDAAAARVRRIHGSPPTVAPAISAGGIVNAASLAGGTIAPGELITIFGSNFGPPGLDVAAAQNNIIPKALNNVHVYFGLGNEGAITARTPNQINVFVPYGVANSTSTQVIVDVDGVTSTPVTVPVASSAFGLSTVDASGSGQGAIFNQDGSYNSHANPAARGSIVTLFGTGEGVTTPALPDGALVISTPYSTTQAAVTVKFGEKTATIQYAGAAPFLPTGVFQIDATIPAGVSPGDVPIAVSIGGISTTRTVTVAVE